MMDLFVQILRKKRGRQRCPCGSAIAAASFVDPSTWMMSPVVQMVGTTYCLCSFFFLKQGNNCSLQITIMMS